ncbi:type VI secretion system protein TssA [Citrobacter sp. wls831]|uniref:type VI secretion system protein TssA n=1 Tax=Citrobacter sp. wls831 TaxID=2576410 RepID=UPI0010C94BD3|nr:type VI secretion system protein TssA [Citrobacter sp. wls831]ELK6843041.1 type VI secretion system protein TssA [Citrobacter braakii]TKU03875.1 type VI secretion system protein TssA [Citrobacter sp. wls831]
MSTMPPEIAALLKPFSPGNPAGINLEYEQIYDDIRQARESDPDYLPEDEWSISEPRRADWNKVRTLCVTALSQQSKDLQLGCWLVESLTHLQGVEGTEMGLGFLTEFITSFWLQCWPLPEDEDSADFRYGKLIRLDRDISLALYSHPLLGVPESTLAHWHKVLAFEHSVSMKPDLLNDLIAKDGDLSVATFDTLAAQFSSIEISLRADCLERLQHQLDRLEACYFSLSQKSAHALFAQTRQTLTNIADFLQRLSQRAIPCGYESDNLHFPGAVGEEYAMFETQEKGPIPNREDIFTRERAISQMLSIAHFFRQSEPSSPVPFLMERAARWANMTLTEWLEEMLTDSNSLCEINNVLKGQQQ